MEAWHERFGRQEAEVTVAAKDSKSVDFRFAAKEVRNNRFLRSTRFASAFRFLPD